MTDTAQTAKPLTPAIYALFIERFCGIRLFNGSRRVG
jgi:hypothetical protein